LEAQAFAQLPDGRLVTVYYDNHLSRYYVAAQRYDVPG
jgi:endonuclease/exonuclease/phosphatase (EEP) superfamily protein YafD